MEAIGFDFEHGRLDTSAFDQAIADDPPDPYVKALLLSRVGRYEETREVLADEGRKRAPCCWRRCWQQSGARMQTR